MTQYSELKSALQPHLPWHGARLSFLALFLLALLKVRTVNLSDLALGFSGEAQVESKYKRLHRFFRHFDIDYTGLMLHQSQPIGLKKHQRRVKSLFRLGFDYLRNLVLNPSEHHHSDFQRSLKLLSCT